MLCFFHFTISGGDCNSSLLSEEIHILDVSGPQGGGDVPPEGQFQLQHGHISQRKLGRVDDFLRLRVMLFVGVQAAESHVQGDPADA